jgi:hypothetical protein
MAKLLDGIILTGTTRDYPSVAAILDFFDPVATPARNNDELHVHLSSKKLAPEIAWLNVRRRVVPQWGKHPNNFRPPRREGRLIASNSDADVAEVVHANDGNDRSAGMHLPS